MTRCALLKTSKFIAIGLVCIVCFANYAQAQTASEIQRQQQEHQQQAAQQQEAQQRAREQANQHRKDLEAKQKRKHDEGAANAVLTEEELLSSEKSRLEPEKQETQRYQDFLRQPETGLCKILAPQSNIVTNVKARNELVRLLGGGTYYSFSKRNHTMDNRAELRLRENALQTGFSGESLSFMTLLGDIPLTAITIENPGVRHFANFAVPTSLSNAEQLHQQAATTGLNFDGFLGKAELPALVNQVYLLRSINYRRNDQLVAFRIVKRYEDGALLILWKRLKTYPKPVLFKNAPNKWLLQSASNQ